MIAHVLELLAVIYVIGHLAAGHANHGRRRARGHRVNYGWSLARGPWVRVRLGGGFSWFRRV